MIRRSMLLLGLACGCASGGSTVQAADSPRQPTIFQSAETGTILGEAPHAATIEIAAPPATVWLAVKSVYLEMEIPITVENPGAHQIGNPNFIKSRQMAGQSMVNWVNCGSSMTGEKASTYRMYLSLLSSVNGDGKGGT